MAQVYEGAIKIVPTPEELDIIEDLGLTPSEVVETVARRILASRVSELNEVEMQQVDGFVPGFESAVAARPKRHSGSDLWVRGVEGNIPDFEDAVVVMHNYAGDCAVEPDCRLRIIADHVTTYIAELGLGLRLEED